MGKEIRIYIWTDANPFREDRCAVRYELQVLRENGPTASKTDGFTTTATQIGATLEGLVVALRRVKEDNKITIVVICKGNVVGVISSGTYLDWKEREWKTRRGEPPAYVNLWKEISDLFSWRTTKVSAREPCPEDENVINRLLAERKKGKTA